MVMFVFNSPMLIIQMAIVTKHNEWIGSMTSILDDKYQKWFQLYFPQDKVFRSIAMLEQAL